MIAAVVQMTSGVDLTHNLERAAHWIARAAQAGAELISLPENMPILREENDSAPHPFAQDMKDGPVVRFLSEQARTHGVWLAGGTLPERVPEDPDRVYNTAVLHAPDGELCASYRKIHLFDVDVPGAVLRESRGAAAGTEAVVAHTVRAAIGLTVCYDLRFPELYRELVARGAQILLVPSAFTVPTGRDHWEILLRARAIENQCFVLAAGQYGEHNSTRRSYGRSMIIDPWGVVLATVPDGEGFATARLDFEAQAEVRRRLPALAHRRL
ncbi:MAG: carbon-nitrogen hydrolase family protein [bacterium]|nr:carbon-nitrogen hydrolase family protein [bacterium]